MPNSSLFFYSVHWALKYLVFFARIFPVFEVFPFSFPWPFHFVDRNCYVIITVMSSGVVKKMLHTQLPTPFWMWFLWLLKRMLKGVSLFPTYCNLQILHSMLLMTQEHWQSTEWSISKTLQSLIPVKVGALFMWLHRLHLGLLQGSQPP